MADPQALGQIRNASFVSVTSCEHGTVFVRLHDEGDNIFAVASIPSAIAADFAKSVATAIATAKPGLASMTCDGTA